jgi:RNA polymerase sigma factor (sigma-70 family)
VTAVHTSDPAPPDDAALAHAIATGDPAGLDRAYRRYAGGLYTYARLLTGDRAAAVDTVHETFLVATEHVTRLSDPARLRPWLYAVARNVGLRRLRRRSRKAPPEPGELAEGAALPREPQEAGVADMVRAATSGLSESDREIVELAVRHRLPAAEVAAVLELPLTRAHDRLYRAREEFLVCLGVLLVARESPCPELAGLLRDWDGRLNPVLRKRLQRHIDGCRACGSIHRSHLDPATLLSTAASPPLLTAPGLQRAGLLRPTGTAAGRQARPTSAAPGRQLRPTGAAADRRPAKSARRIRWTREGFPAGGVAWRWWWAVAAAVTAALAIAAGAVAASVHNGP